MICRSLEGGVGLIKVSSGGCACRGGGRRGWSLEDKAGLDDSGFFQLPIHCF